MSNERCPKCGARLRYRSKLYDGEPYPSGYICPLNPKDCRIKELESQLRAREADVLALRSTLKMAWHFVGAKDLSAQGRMAISCDIDRALSNTSATSQEITRRIEKEALARALDRADRASRNCYSEPLYTDIGKAILGEEV